MKQIIIILTFILSVTGLVASGQTGVQKAKQTIKISQIDSTLIGVELKKAMSILMVDSTSLRPFDEPPMILRGVWGMLPDSTEIILYVDRTPGETYSQIKNKKIIGVAWADKNGNEKYLGRVISYYTLKNKYANKK